MGWIRHTSHIVYDNDWMTVREDQVTNPGGGSNLYGHVHFKNLAVAILPIDEQGNTRLVGQTRYTLGQYSWELPMGGAPLQEDPLEAAKRELREETGLVASDWQEILRLHPSNSVTDELGIAYVARDLAEGPMALEDTEDITVRMVSVDEAVDMALDGRISDAISAAALFRFALGRPAP